MAGRTSCRNGCGAVLRVITREGGAGMLTVNPVPDPAGNVAAHRLRDGSYRDAYFLSKERPLREGWTRFRIHAADCSDPSELKPMPPNLAELAKPEPSLTPTESLF